MISDELFWFSRWARGEVGLGSNELSVLFGVNIGSQRKCGHKRFRTLHASKRCNGRDCYEFKDVCAWLRGGEARLIGRIFPRLRTLSKHATADSLVEFIIRLDAAKARYEIGLVEAEIWKVGDLIKRRSENVPEHV